MKTEIATQWDDWLEDQDKAVWVADTNLGRVYQDDGRPGFLYSAWERMIIAQPKITRLGLRFRDHYEWLPENKAGYYFIKSILKGPLMEKDFHYYIIGYLEDGVVKCKKFKIPELIIDEEFDRPPEKCGESQYGSLLIC